MLSPRLALSAALLLPASLLAAEPLVELRAGLYAAGSGRDLASDFEPSPPADRFENINSASRAHVEARFNFSPVDVKAVYERGFRNDIAGIMPERARYLEAHSRFGTLLLGDAPSAFRRAGETLDPFFDTAIAGFNGRALGEGANYGLSNLTNSITRNSLAYTSPELFGGLRLNAAGYLGTKDAPNDEVDLGLGFAYTFGDLGGEGQALTVGAQALQIENPTAFALGNSRLNRRSPVGGSPGVSDNLRVHAAYTTPRLSLGLSAEHIDVKAEPDARGYLFGSVSYAATPVVRVAASYGYLDFKTGSPALSGSSYAVGAFVRMSPAATSYVAVRQTSLDTPGDATIVALGLSLALERRLFAYGSAEDRASAADASAAPQPVE